MLNMRPFQIIVISVFAVLALGGLFIFATFKGFGQGKPVGVVTIWGTLPASAVQQGIDDLRRTHQEFGKVTYQEKDAATFDSALSDALASGAGPDLIITNQEHLLTERNKLAVIPFSSIPQRTYQDLYVPINELYLTPTGTYAIPLAVDPLVLYYNRASLSSANIPQVPSTWEAIIGVTPKLTTVSGAGNISKSAIPLGTYENIPHARGIVSLLLLQSGSSITEETASGRRSALVSGGASGSGVTPGESAMNFYTQFADPAKIVYTWNRSFTDGRQSFIGGDAAFYIGLASERPQLTAANPNLDFDMAPIPQPQTASAQADYGIAYAFALTKGGKNSSGAYRTASALAASAEAKIIVGALGMAPALRSLLIPDANDRYTPIIYADALMAKGWLSPAPAATDSVFAGMINSIISGQQNVRDALSTADQSLTALLQ